MYQKDVHVCVSGVIIVKLKRVGVSNYRNLDGTEISLHPTINFIVGENNVGKSNFLSMLNTLFSRNSFRGSDFLDKTRPLEIRMTYWLEEQEKGMFDDLFDPTNCDLLNITAIQDSEEESIRFIHTETHTPVSATSIRRANFIYYDSIRRPDTELNFYRNQGAGKFLSRLISSYLERNELIGSDFISGQMSQMIGDLNAKLQLLRPVNEFALTVALESNIGDLLGKVLQIADPNNIGIRDTGYGVQYVTLIPLVIIDRILQISTSKNFLPLTDASDGRVVPVILGLDEPEIHLHPFMQRTLMKYLLQIVKNLDQSFSTLLNDLIDVSGVTGQIIAVTHSPNIVLNDYRNIIHFAKTANGKVRATCGNDIVLEQKHTKQLLRNMQYIKEAFFSNCVILVEGDSEYGALPLMANSMLGDIDRFGISIIQANGGDSIPPMSQLLDAFGIPNVGILDLDKKSSYQDQPNLYFTDCADFEEEVFESMNFVQYVRFLEEYYPETQNFFIAESKRLGLSIDPRTRPLSEQLESMPSESLEALKANTKQIILDFLERNKGVILGQQLAEYVPIPAVYKRVVEKAKELSQSVTRAGIERP